MLVLVGKSPNTLPRHPNLGLLTSPRIGTDLTEWDGAWAADNDAFNGGFDPVAYVRMLTRYKDLSGCLWVSAPDVVGDAAATLKLLEEWGPLVEEKGYPVALVGQDGLTVDTAPWDRFDALFIGGSTQWKLGAEARSLVREALLLGYSVHMGRVNSRRRIKYAKAIGCHSVDGTATVRFTDQKLPPILEWAAAPRQGIL